MRQRLLWLAIYALAMAYLESAVVVYLRAVYYPAGFAFPLVPMPSTMAVIEIGRELATLLMILGVAALAGKSGWQRFLIFNIVFGVWDLFYYVWLWVFLRWPPSLLTWDILFLIPVPWLGPVLAPVIISLTLIVVSAWLWLLDERGTSLRLTRAHWMAAVVGGGLVLLSLTIDYRSAVTMQMPAPFRWDLFGLGVAVALLSVWHAAVIAARRHAPH